MNESQALSTLAANPSLVLQHFNITREEVLEAYALARVKEERRELVHGYNELCLLRLPHASRLLGITKDRICQEIDHVDWGKRNQKVSQADLINLKNKYTIRARSNCPE